MRILEPPGRNLARILGWISFLWGTDTQTKRKGQSSLQSGDGALVAVAVAEARWHVIGSEVEECEGPQNQRRTGRHGWGRVSFGRHGANEDPPMSSTPRPLFWGFQRKDSEAS